VRLDVAGDAAALLAKYAPIRNRPVSFCQRCVVDEEEDELNEKDGGGGGGCGARDG
jgi:hypothetical protein